MVTWKRYAPIHRAPCEYLDAGQGYTPGRVNSVEVYAEFEKFLLYVTDGYKTQFAGAFETSADAKAIGEHKIRDGHGSWFGHGKI